MHKLKEIQKYLKDVLEADRIEFLYTMISNPHLRINSEDQITSKRL